MTIKTIIQSLRRVKHPEIDAIESQEKAIKRWLESGKSITPMEALKRFRCFRLGARIFDLKNKGMDIITEPYITPTGKRVARYYLAKRGKRIK